jgi:hypothetical protein
MHVGGRLKNCPKQHQAKHLGTNRKKGNIVQGTNRCKGLDVQGQIIRGPTVRENMYKASMLPKTYKYMEVNVNILNS